MTPRTWTPEEDAALKAAVIEARQAGRSAASACRKHGRAWQRSAGACQERWQKISVDVPASELESRVRRPQGRPKEAHVDGPARARKSEAFIAALFDGRSFG